ncbi:MAG: M3 family oligoendopeptidase [Candidatus Altiarchaeota archaeon]
MVSWVLDDIYKPGERERLVGELRGRVEDFKAYRSKLGDCLSTEEFLHILKEDEELTKVASRLSAYAGLLSSEDTSDSKRLSHEARISQFCAEAGNETMFFGLWFRDLSDEKAGEYIRASGPYHYMLERVRAFRRHTLRENEERIINLKDLTGSEALTRLYDLITNRFTFKVEGRMVSFDEAARLKMSPKRSLRLSAHNAVLEKYACEEAVLGEIYCNVIRDWANENVRLRNFTTPIAPVNLGNDLPDKVVEAMLKAIKDNRKIFHRYFRVKAKACGLGKLDRYDIYIPYHKKERKYSFIECKKILLSTYKSFDESVYLMGRRMFDEKHVHSELRKNKQRGAFCSSVNKGFTPYIMLNHVGRLDDLYAMMHEFGHGVHSIAAGGQTELTYQAGLPLAETASIFSEMLLTERLLEELPGEEKPAILLRMLDSQYGSILRQAYFTLFELEAHRMVGEGASADSLDAFYLKSLKEQFGRIVEVPEIFQEEWKCIQHIYHSPFYCYCYAFGNLLVLALYGMYKKEGRDFTPKYLKILSYGGSESPTKILEEAGVDFNKPGFWKQGLASIQQEIKRLEKIIQDRAEG